MRQIIFIALIFTSFAVFGQNRYTVRIPTATEQDGNIGNEFGDITVSNDSVFYRQCPTCSYSFKFLLSDLADGSETIITEGTNITVTGTGTVGDPYVISSTASGGGTDLDSIVGNEYNTAFGLSGTTLQITDGGGTLSQDLSGIIPTTYWSRSTTNTYLTNAGDRVGINTSSPSTKLHVVGSGYTDHFRLQGSGGGVGMSFNGGTQTDYLWYNDSGKSFAFGGGGPGGTKKLHIDGGTTIGANIDSQSPQTNGLYVEGNISVGHVGVSDHAAYFSPTNAIKIPFGTTAQRPATPLSGSLRINETKARIEFYYPSSWYQVLATPFDLTEGSIIFADVNGNPNQDNANLFFNNTSKRLGVGTNTPTSTFHVIGGSKSSTFQYNSFDAPAVMKNGTSVGTGLAFQDISGTYNLWANQGTFNLGGSGTYVANKKLHIDGGVTIGANYDGTSVNSNGLYIEGDLRVNTLSATATTIGGYSSTNIATKLTLGTGFSIASGALNFTETYTGTVTSVGLSMPSIFSVSGSPVTGSGTLTATLASQTTNLVFASPNGSTGTPTFRALAIADLPTLATSNLSDFPSQSGNSGKFLTTNGTSLSWGTVASATNIYNSDGSIPAATSREVTIGAASNIFFTDGAGLLNYEIGDDYMTALITDGAGNSSTLDLQSTYGKLGYDTDNFINFNENGATLSLNGSTGTSGYVLKSGGAGTMYWDALTGSGTVTSIATNNGITGGTITTSGTIGLTGQALALHNLASNGIISRTGSGTVAARTITAGTGISISNGDGVSGNPTITNTGDTNAADDMLLFNGSSSADYNTLTTNGIYRATGATNGPSGAAHSTMFTAMQSGNYGWQLAGIGNDAFYMRWENGGSWGSWSQLASRSWASANFLTSEVDGSTSNELQSISTSGAAGNITISSGNTLNLNVNDADASTSNEIQTISKSGNAVSLSLSGGSFNIANDTPADGEVLTWSAGNWIASAAGSGTVTSVALTTNTSGTDIAVSGSPITTSGTFTLSIPTASGSARGALSSSDWTTFNNKVGGSGTSTRVAFWSGSSTLSSNANLYWDNTNSRLGIGTSPSVKLHVVGSGYADHLRVEGTSGGSGISFYGGANLDYIWYSDAGKIFAIGGGGASGTNKKLHVDGGVTIGANYDATAVDANGLKVEGAVLLNNLSGSGTRMVTASSTGVLSTDAIPSENTTNELITSFTTSGNSITIIEAGVSRGVTAPNLYTVNGSLAGITRTVGIGSGGELNFVGTGLTSIGDDGFLSNRSNNGIAVLSTDVSMYNTTSNTELSINSTGAKLEVNGSYGVAGNALVSGGSGSSVSWGKPVATQVDLYTSSSTWTKPSGCKTVTVTVIGGGGGGGGGSYIDNSTHNSGSGGGGGGAGGRSQETLDCASISGTVSITVGSGGSGGSAQSSLPANGNTGSPGNQSSFGSYLKANGGGGGQGGQLSATSTGGSAGLGSSCDGGMGGGSNNTATSGTTGEAARFASGGGNGGAGVTTSSGGSNTTSTSPALGTTGSVTLLGSGGTGAAAANPGGSAGIYGGGGGGGGAGRSATHIQGGAGASGASGVVQVITNF